MFPEAARALLEGLLQKKPKNRFDTKDIFAHAFFSGIDWAALDKGTLPPPFVPSEDDMHTIAADAVGDIDTAGGDRFGWDQEKRDFTDKEKAKFEKFGYIGALSFQDELVDGLSRGGVLEFALQEESPSESKDGRRSSVRRRKSSSASASKVGSQKKMSVANIFKKNDDLDKNIDRAVVTRASIKERHEVNPYAGRGKDHYAKIKRAKAAQRRRKEKPSTSVCSVQ